VRELFFQLLDLVSEFVEFVLLIVPHLANGTVVSFFVAHLQVA